MVVVGEGEMHRDRLVAYTHFQRAAEGVLGGLQGAFFSPLAAAFILATAASLAVAVVVLAGFWKVFTKAGQPGWAAIVPIYNLGFASDDRVDGVLDRTRRAAQVSAL